MFEITKWEARFYGAAIITGIVTLLLGLPAAFLYGVWWLVHHVRFT